MNRRLKPPTTAHSLIQRTIVGMNQAVLHRSTIIDINDMNVAVIISHHLHWSGHLIILSRNISLHKTLHP